MTIATFLTGSAQRVSNPFFGAITSPDAINLRGQTITRLQLLRPFPQYESVTLTRPHWGASKYHALQINLQKRFSDGLSATVNFTRSKMLDTSGVGNAAGGLDITPIQNIYDYAREYSYSTLDVPNRFVAAWTYELPFGKGKAFGKNWGGLARTFLGGWQTSGQFVWQSGTPIQISATGFSVGVGNAVRRPDKVAGSDASFALSDARKRVRSGGTWFDTSVFTQPDDFIFGNAARTYNDVRRDSYRNVNLSLLKSFFWAEGRQKLQLRAEFLNAFNLVVMGTPGSRLGVAPNADQTGFGQIRTQGNTPRIIQLVVRYTF
jgi:hypothetical protein